MTKRRTLLTQLRSESDRIRFGFFSRAEAPALYDLAMAAKSARGRTVTYCGVRFPLVPGLMRDVCDPETGRVLVAAAGGWLI